MIGNMITNLGSRPIGVGTVEVQPANNFVVAGSPTNYSFSALVVFSLEESDKKEESYNIIFSLKKKETGSDKELATLKIPAKNVSTDPGKSSVLTVTFTNVLIENIGVFDLVMSINGKQVCDAELQFTTKSQN